MWTLLTYVVLGLATGSVYGLSAFGIILVYRGSGIVNFASGGFATVGAFIYYDLTNSGAAPWPVAALLGTLISGVLSAATYLLIIKPMRKSSILTRTMATLGVFVTTNAALVIWEPNDELSVRSFYPNGAWHPGHGLVLGYDLIIIFVISVIAAVVLGTIWRRTAFGLKTSAVAENQRSASALGISPDVVAGTNWLIGGALAGLAAILLIPVLGLQIATITGLLFPSLVAALVGRMDRFLPALIGGLGIGIAQAVITGYYPTTPGLTTIVPFVGVLVLLVVRGQAIPDRAFLRDRLPLVGTGRVRPVPLLIGAAILLAVIWGFGPEYADAMITTMGTAIVLLSVVVVTGYAGQISLCQFALAGLGTFVAGRLTAAAHVPLLLAALISIVVAMVAGVIVGLPALRSRGVSLAVLTLGFAVVLEDAVFQNSTFAGVFGDNIGTVSIFGLNLDATTDPARYATFAAIIFLLLAILAAKVRRGTVGRRLLAVRGSERAAAALGINVYAAKLAAFSLAAGIAAIGGMVLAFSSPSLVYSSSYDYTLSIDMLVFAVIGGIGFLAGPVAAAAAVVTGGLAYQVLDFLREGNDELLTFIGGIGLIFVLWTAPDGIAKQTSDLLMTIGRKLGTSNLASRWRLDIFFHPAFAVPNGRALARVTPAPAATRQHARVAPHTLSVRDMTVRFSGVVALDGVSIELRPGEVLGLIGPNGAGKTTLIDVVTGYVSPSSGTIELNGQRLNELGVARRAQLGIGRSFQNLELFDDLTVLENLQVACDSRGLSRYFTDLVLPRRSELSANAREIVRLFDLEDLLDRKVSELPYGRRRLCAIARAAAATPGVLLLDEPAAGLGSHEVAEVSRLVAELAKQQGVAVLLIEHNIDLVIGVCDRVVVLDFGKEIAQGTPDEVRRNEEVLRAYMGISVEESGAPGAIATQTPAGAEVDGGRAR